jgi:hypothetical protein
MNIPIDIANYAKKIGLEWISTGGNVDYIIRESPDRITQILLDNDHESLKDRPGIIYIYTAPPGETDLDNIWFEDNMETKEFPTVKEAMDFMANVHFTDKIKTGTIEPLFMKLPFIFNGKPYYFTGSTFDGDMGSHEQPPSDPELEIDFKLEKVIYQALDEQYPQDQTLEDY